KHPNDLSKTLNLIADFIPQGWQYPNHLFAYILVDQNYYGTICGEGEGKNCQSAMININGKERGKVMVCYKAAVPNEQQVFLEEEQALINQIALDLSSTIELF